MNNEVKKGINTTFEGFYKTAIVNGTTGEVVWESDWAKNLILNQGMNGLYSNTIADCMLIGVAGTGTRPNSISGLTSEISQSGTNAFLSVRTGLTDLTSSAETYAAGVQVGDMIKYANNSESMVTAVTDGFNLVMSQSYTFTPGQTFTIWKTSQAGLQSEVKRAGTGVTETQYSLDINQNYTISSSNVLSWKRTYDFAIETGAVTYGELGVSWATSGPTTVFSRVLLSPTIAIDSGFRLRMAYQLNGTFTPNTEQYKTASIGGWPVSPATNTIGTESLQQMYVSTINPTTAATVLTNAVLDPSFTTGGTGISVIWASPSSASLAPIGYDVDRSTNGAQSAVMTKAAYTNMFTCDKTGILTSGQIARTDIRTIGMGRDTASQNGYGPSGSVIAFRFNETQSKNSLQTLSLTYRWTWARTLA